MTIAAVVNRLADPNPSPLLKQSPTTVLFGVAIVMVAFNPVSVTSLGAVVAGTIAAILATVLAGVLTAIPTVAKFVLLVPAIDLIAIGFLRYGTGESLSIFSSLVILPIIWFAAEEGREHIWFAFIGTAIVLIIPAVAGQSDSSALSLMLRAAFAAVVFTIAAAVINELSRQARLRLSSVRRLAEERQRALESNEARTNQLAASEASLRQAQRMFRGVWGAVTQQAVIGTDLTGLIDAWNPGAALMLRIDAAEVEDKRHVDEFHLADELEDRARELRYPAGATVLNPGFSALVEEARLGSAEVREWTYRRADGTELPVELSVTPRLDDADETVGYLFVAHDRTKAHEVAKLKDDFVGLISHELRTPLSSILGYLELMRDDDDEQLTETQLQYLGVAERNAHRLLTLVGDLLFTAQVESGKFNLETHVQSMSPIVSAAVDSARPAAVRAGVNLIDEIVDGGMVRGDSVRLGQACDNLISNAIKFTPAGGTVTVTLGGEATHVVVSVSDTGMGIAESELDQLFSRFFRASTATRNAVPGVGLGLTITKAIVTAHGGEMSVASEEGAGTNFSMKLPIEQPVWV
ncbi:MAG: PAS domain-containing protein [Microbacteriaceae bacterium]|nr:PAS domain-containing protein [Microbacteriaceae bacterium]